MKLSQSIFMLCRFLRHKKGYGKLKEKDFDMTELIGPALPPRYNEACEAKKQKNPQTPETAYVQVENPNLANESVASEKDHQNAQSLVDGNDSLWPGSLQMNSLKEMNPETQSALSKMNHRELVTFLRNISKDKVNNPAAYADIVIALVSKGIVKNPKDIEIAKYVANLRVTSVKKDLGDKMSLMSRLAESNPKADIPHFSNEEIATFQEAFGRIAKEAIKNNDLSSLNFEKVFKALAQDPNIKDNRKLCIYAEKISRHVNIRDIVLGDVSDRADAIIQFETGFYRWLGSKDGVSEQLAEKRSKYATVQEFQDAVILNYQKRKILLSEEQIKTLKERLQKIWDQDQRAKNNRTVTIQGIQYAARLQESGWSMEDIQTKVTNFEDFIAQKKEIVESPNISTDTRKTSPETTTEPSVSSFENIHWKTDANGQQVAVFEDCLLHFSPDGQKIIAKDVSGFEMEFKKEIGVVSIADTMQTLRETGLSNIPQYALTTALQVWNTQANNTGKADLGIYLQDGLQAGSSRALEKKNLVLLAETLFMSPQTSSDLGTRISKLKTQTENNWGKLLVTIENAGDTAWLVKRDLQETPLKNLIAQKIGSSEPTQTSPTEDHSALLNQIS